MRIAPAMAVALGLSACGTTSQYHPVSDGPVRIGRPYTVHGITYVPAANPDYDVLGYASFYGSESGHTTANGEYFRPSGISAAHATLPLPSYVEVTSLETGRVILVRINDRGPFAGHRRIIDLSSGAAALLGIGRQGIVPVRVRVVEPPDNDRKRLREGRPAAVRPNVSGQTLAQLRGEWADLGGHLAENAVSGSRAR